MRPPTDDSAIEAPLVWLILILVAAPLLLFGIGYGINVRAESQAQAKRETTYQAALRSYAEILKSGVTRKEVEEYLRFHKTEFLRSSTDDLVEIGDEGPPNWFCGKSSVYLRFQFQVSSQPGNGPDRANERDTLDEIKILRMAGPCL